MLGVSRGTLRSALERLSETGVIVRRQGSGTFVGHLVRPTAFDEGLERLVSYAALARGAGVKLSVEGLKIDQLELDERLAGTFELPLGALATEIERTVLADGAPAAIMRDVVAPGIALPPDSTLRQALTRGDMVLDVLLNQGVPIVFATTRITARLLTPRQPTARALGIEKSTATLEMEATHRLSTGRVVQASRDLFAPGRLDLHVLRLLDVPRPPQVAG